MNRYEDIINLPHKQSATRPHMAISDRAAQFAPFAALTGYEEEVAEAARLTDQQIVLSDEQLEVLNTRLTYLKRRLHERPQIKITFFSADDKKDGGFYQEVSGVIRQIDDYKRIVTLEDGSAISFDAIYAIEDETESGHLFQ